MVVWALAAGSALFWGLKLATRPTAVPAQAQVAAAGPGLRGDLSRLLGADPVPVAEPAPAAPSADARFSLVGVVAPRAAQSAREGVALIAVDGQPARAYRIGAAVADGHVLSAVSARGATLGPRDGGPAVALSVAPPAPAARGTLPAAGAAATPAEPPARAPRAPRQARQSPPADPPPAASADGDAAVR